MTVIISKVAAIFLIIAIGFIANRRGILPADARPHLVDLLMLILTPCMIASALLTTEVSEELWVDTLKMLLGGVIFFLVATGFAFLVCIKILKIQPQKGAGVYMVCMATVNNGFMGLPITFALFGSQALYFMVFFQVVLTLYLYSMGILLVNYGFGEKKEIKAMMKSMVNPSTVVAILSIILVFVGCPLPQILLDTLKQIGDAVVPISMLLIGMLLGTSNLWKLFKNRWIVLTSVIKMVCLPIFTFLVVDLFSLPIPVKIALIFGAAFPSAVACVPIASMEDKDAVLAAEIVSFTTLLSLGTLPAVAVFLTGYFHIG